MSAVLGALGLVAALGCQLLPAASPTPDLTAPTPAASDTATDQPPTEPSPTPEQNVPTPTPTTVPEAEFEFIRWTGPQVLAAEPGGALYVDDSMIESLAAVVDRVEIDGVEWVRVQYGSERSVDFSKYVWTPSRAEVGPDAVVQSVYEYVTPDCPSDPPTVADLSGMPPLQIVHCFGPREMTFAPVWVRDIGTESPFIHDGPEWLAVGLGFVMEWLPERQEMGGIPIYVEPASGIVINTHEWAEITGRVDHPAARECTLGEDLGWEYPLATDDEAVNQCRGRFVVTGVRLLSEGEIPPAPVVATPGPAPERTVPVALKEIRGPIGTRVEAASAWTGTELIVWGGSEKAREGAFGGSRETKTGAAYDPAAGTWRRISDGPLSARSSPLSAWTGTEMLVWGGYEEDGKRFSNGAAYDPASDSWRPISNSLLAWRFESDSVWTGDEWWVAVSPASDRVRLAAYDPATDRWRDLPEPAGASNFVELVWGDGFVMMLSNGNFYVMAPGASEWSTQAVDFHGPVVWGDGVLYGTRFDALEAADPFGSDRWSYPVAWDPHAMAAIEMQLPPNDTFGGIWTGTHLAFFGNGLAFDPSSGTWVYLLVDHPAGLPMERVGAVNVWADDSLIVWGGWSGCFSIDPEYDVGYELIPQWQSGALEGVRVGSQPRSLGAVAKSNGHMSDPAQAAFAC